MAAAIVRNLPAKTGRSLDEWVDVLLATAPTGQRKERVAWLKSEHGLGHGQASMVVDAADRPERFAPPDPDELVATLFAGKEALRPLFERVRDAVAGLGPDVEVEPRQTYVAFSRVRQFAVARPSTRNRLDVGLALRDVAPTDRLRQARSFGSDRITHRVALPAENEVDAELLGWLRRAYETAAA